MAVVEIICALSPAWGRAHASDTEGHPQGARVGRRIVRRGTQDGGVAGSALVAPSLLLTSRDVAASPAKARGLAAEVGYPHRAAGRRVVLDPDGAFVTSPALGWTLVGVVDRGLPFERLRRLPGMALPPVQCGVRVDVGLRWVERERIVADLDLRLRVMGGRGARLRTELGL